MVLNPFKKRKDVLQVQAVEIPGDMSVSEVGNIEELNAIKHGDFYFETPEDLLLISQKYNTCFHYGKQGLPRIMKVEKLEVNPDSCCAKAEVAREELFNFARRKGLILFETSDSWIIPSAETTFYCLKEKKP